MFFVIHMYIVCMNEYMSKYCVSWNMNRWSIYIYSIFHKGSGEGCLATGIHIVEQTYENMG